MTDPIIVVGDKTSHGGTVTAGSPIISINGRPVARRKDPVTCPIHGPNHIAEGDEDSNFDGQPVARAKHKTACGATLIPSQSATAVG